ncbi:HAD family hydrolase [Kitasatospora sp. NPDC006786]|uniref:HAD family hydrolase n=1 Tax=unclassified Kitasatospora TaxID=2633591 RepID=UPI0033F1BE24
MVQFLPFLPDHGRTVRLAERVDLESIVSIDPSGHHLGILFQVSPLRRLRGPDQRPVGEGQERATGPILRRLFTDDVDLIGTSDDLGVSKPDLAFFERVAEVTPAEPHEILYVGDRLDSDVLPARAAEMRTALIRRGPWGWIQQHDPAAEQATFRIDSLAELPHLIAEFNAGASRALPTRAGESAYPSGAGSVMRFQYWSSAVPPSQAPLAGWRRPAPPRS